MSTSANQSSKTRELCGVCNKKKAPESTNVSKRIWIQCTCCKVKFHLICVNMESVKLKTNYFCMACLNDSNFSKESAKLNKSLMEEISKDLSKIDSDDFDLLCSTHIEKLWPYIKNKTEDIINEKTEFFAERIKILEAKLDNLHQEQQWQRQQQQINLRANNIIIRGVPVSVGISDFKIIEVIAKKVGFVLSDGDVISMRRFKSVHDGKSNPPIIMVSFNNSQVKSQFLKTFFTAIRNKIAVDMKLFDEAGVTGCTDRIYVSEHLDRGTLNISVKARKMYKLGLISHFISRNDGVFIKLSGNDKFSRINSLNELDLLCTTN